MALGDWLTMIGPFMKDISGCSAVWWETTRRAAQELHQTWRSSTPLGRVQLEPKLPGMMLMEAQFVTSDGKGKGGKQTSSPGNRKGGGDTKLCRYFASEAGCRLGTLLLLLTWMKFPDLPDDVVWKTVPDLSGPVDPEELPRNPRRRRQVERAKKVVCI